MSTQCFRVQEEIQERIISSLADLEAETKRSVTTLQLVEKKCQGKEAENQKIDEKKKSHPDLQILAQVAMNMQGYKAETH